MLAKKCDRCGCCFDLEPCNSVKYDAMELCSFSYEDGVSECEHFDLCPDCINSLNWWLGVFKNEPQKSDSN